MVRCTRNPQLPVNNNNTTSKLELVSMLRRQGIFTVPKNWRFPQSLQKAVWMVLLILKLFINKVYSQIIKYLGIFFQKGGNSCEWVAYSPYYHLAVPSYQHQFPTRKLPTSCVYLVYLVCCHFLYILSFPVADVYFLFLFLIISFSCTFVYCQHQ